MPAKCSVQVALRSGLPGELQSIVVRKGPALELGTRIPRGQGEDFAKTGNGPELGQRIFGTRVSAHCVCPLFTPAGYGIAPFGCPHSHLELFGPRVVYAVRTDEREARRFSGRNLRMYACFKPLTHAAYFLLSRCNPSFQLSIAEIDNSHTIQGTTDLHRLARAHLVSSSIHNPLSITTTLAINYSRAFDWNYGDYIE